MWLPWPSKSTCRTCALVFLTGMFGLLAGCGNDAPQSEDPVDLARYYWQAMANGNANAANSYTLPGALASWQMAPGFSLLHVRDAQQADNALIVPVVLRLATGEEKDISTVLTLSEGNYWVDVEATLSKSWRPEAAALEKALMSDEGFEPDAGDGELR